MLLPVFRPAFTVNALRCAPRFIPVAAALADTSLMTSARQPAPVPRASFEPALTPAPEVPPEWPKMTPGTFVTLKFVR